MCRTCYQAKVVLSGIGSGLPEKSSRGLVADCIGAVNATPSQRFGHLLLRILYYTTAFLRSATFQYIGHLYDFQNSGYLSNVTLTSHRCPCM